MPDNAAVVSETTPVQPPPSPSPSPLIEPAANHLPAAAPRSRRRTRLRMLGLAAGCAVVVLAAWWFISSFDTVSTDDAYVNGHVTFVAPRVSGQVARVL